DGVDDVALRGAGAPRLRLQALRFLFLAEVDAQGDDLRVVRLLEPFEDDGGIETTGIGQNDLHGAGFPLRMRWTRASPEAGGDAGIRGQKRGMILGSAPGHFQRIRERAGGGPAYFGLSGRPSRARRMRAARRVPTPFTRAIAS